MFTPLGSANLATVLVASLLCFGCPSSTPDDPTPPTTTGTGGSMQPSGTGGGSGAGGTTSPDPSAIQPLPTSAFVFYRHTQEGDKAFLHLWTYDLATEQERLISKLDNAIRSFNRTAGDRLAISPDRKWIAFAANFRPSAEDAFHKGATAMLWKVSVDGKQFVRISAPLVDYRPSCPMNLQCKPDHFCDPDTLRCTRGGWSWGFEHPSWSPDGQTIFAHLAETGCSNISCLPNVVLPEIPTLIVVSQAVTLPDRPLAKHTELPQPPPTGTACSTSRPAVSADGKRLAVHYRGCYDVDHIGGVLGANADGTNYQILTAQTYCQATRWRRDGGGVYCSFGAKMLLLTPAGVSGVFDLPAGMDMSAFDFSRDDRYLAIDVLAGGKRNILTADLKATPIGSPIEFVQVTSDGYSGWPAF